MSLSPRACAWLRATLTCAFVSGLSACGGDPPSGAEPVGAAVERLEGNGELPTLERTDSLAGIDANANGVRDDIERHIEKKYSESAQRKAAMQTARGFQQSLLVDTGDAAALQAVSAAVMRAANCRRSVFASPQDAAAAAQMSDELEAMTANTKQRLLAYLAYNKALSGSVSSLPKGDTCD